MIVISRTPDGTKIRAPAGVPPPHGATTASFVLFAALAALLGIAYAASEWIHLGGEFGFPSDGAWTRAVLARNLVEGKGLSFNPGVPVAGAPGPSWLAALAAGGYLLGDFVGGAKLLGVWMVALTSYLVWMITLDLLRDWRFAFLAAIACVSAPNLIEAGLSGTESAMAALLVAATIYWQAGAWGGERRQRAALVAACGLGALSRPELVLLLPLIVLDRGLLALVKRPSRGLPLTARLGLAEAAGAAALAIPYLIYNLRVGGGLWQRPELSIRPHGAFVWAAAALAQLWHTSPLLLIAAAAGLPVALLSAARPRSRHPSFLLALIPLAVLLAPGAIWRNAAASNGVYTAAYLTPAVSILGAAGLFLLHRTAGLLRLRLRPAVASAAFPVAIALTVCGLVIPSWSAHRAAWQRHGMAVKKVSSLQAAIGKRAAEHLPPDASIASREVGAIGFYSRRRMIDLGGTIDRAGYLAISAPGSPDDNLLLFLQKVKPSYVALRPSDFPYLTQRTDILQEVLTCYATDDISGGITTMKLYQTPWPPPSMRALRIQTGTE